MDSTTIMFIVIGVILLIVWYFFSRNRVAPRGTYNDENYRSSGSIGGTQRGYDDPDLRSTGSIGGSNRPSYDAPDVESRGSIGGAPSSQRPRSQPRPEDRERPRHDSKDFKSGGSIGG